MTGKRKERRERGEGKRGGRDKRRGGRVTGKRGESAISILIYTHSKAIHLQRTYLGKLRRSIGEGPSRFASDGRKESAGFCPRDLRFSL